MATTREIAALVEASRVFPGAEALVVAGALPPPGLGELGVRTMAVGRFLTQGPGPVERGATGRDQAPEPAAQVLAHLREHPPITRSEVAALCALTAPQASRLLRRLAAAGEIVRQGAGRGTSYGLPSPSVTPRTGR